VLYLLSRKQENSKRPKPCWKIKGCPAERKRSCPAWEFRTGTSCWFINGTMCEGEVQKDWTDKMKLCRKCEVLSPLLQASAKA
jgi:hypothetical protein